jgi:2-iminobutanoate/2-iminopropanoate deaminase
MLAKEPMPTSMNTDQSVCQLRYDAAMSTQTTSPFVYASSLAIDVETMRRVPEAGTIAQETDVVLDRIAARLAHAGLALRDVVKTTCYVSDDAYRMDFVAAYKERFAPGPYPARVTVVLGLAGDCRVQVEAVAAAPATEDVN